MKWINIPVNREMGSGGNQILYLDDFCISYNPSPSAEGVGGLFNSFGELAGLDHRQAETALIKGENYYILNGDFRKEYEKLAAKGFKHCLNFFIKNEELWSKWTTKYELLTEGEQ